jgi:ribonucleoside-diphosphate reductase alpha chain
MSRKAWTMATTEPRFSDNALQVLCDRYLHRDETGALVETPTGMLERVARAVAEPARLFGEDSDFCEARFYERMHRLEFLPNSPTLMNAGLPAGQLPGLLFLDEINRHIPTPALGSIEAINPCGEQPLLPYESCTLGSINLALFTSAINIDWPRLKSAVRDAVVFLDNVIEANCYPLPEIETATRRTRKTGLGIMGFAELLAQIGVAYDSEAGLEVGGKIAAFLRNEARAASCELGTRRGSFPAFRGSVLVKPGLLALRNASITCVAPTGTLSLIAGTSSGIEPFFALVMIRRILDGRLRPRDARHQFHRERRYFTHAEESNLRFTGIGL